MAQPKVNTITNLYKIGKGNLSISLLNADGSYDGYRFFGNCPEFDITVASDTITHTNSQGGIDEVDATVPKSITRTGKVTCDNLSIENLLLFLSANESTISQTATPVTGYSIPNAKANRTYQLGETTGNPSGVRGVGSVTVAFDTTDAVTRANSTAYPKGELIIPATPNAHLYLVTVAGTSGSSVPTFPTSGGTVADGTATLQDLGTIAVTAADANYLVDTNLGLLSIVPGGTLDTASALMIGLDVNDIDGIPLAIGYTPVAQSRVQIATGSSAQLTGKLMFIADNPFGANQDVRMPSVTLSPSGDLPFIGEDFAVMTFDVGINTLDSNTPAILIDGRPL